MLLTKPPIISYNLFLSSTNNRPRHSSAQSFLMVSIWQDPSKCAQYTSPNLFDFIFYSSTPGSLYSNYKNLPTVPQNNSSRKAFAFKCPICLLHCSPHIEGWRSCSFSSLRSLLNILSKPVPNKTILNRNPFPNHRHSAFPIPLSCFTFTP